MSTIHSSVQIEWFKNSVDDRSVQIGRKQRICTIYGYAMPLTWSGELMYLSILGKPTDKGLERYPADRIPSTTPGADPPRDARDSGSARSHSTHLGTSSSDRP